MTLMLAGGIFLVATTIDFVVALIGLLILINAILLFLTMGQLRSYHRKTMVEQETAAEAKTTWWHLFDRATTMPDQVMKNHEYDGIREYDNNPPAWFNWLFYLSIAWAVIYMLWFHVFKLSPLQEEAYAQEMQKAEIMLASTVADRKIDFDKVEPYVEESKIALGQQVFATNCVACHAENAGGGTGPNLTDQYWLHGGGFKDIVHTIMEGVPSKGMISWKKLLSSEEILEVASYVQSIRGTNVPGGKEPQGDIYEGK